MGFGSRLSVKILLEVNLGSPDAFKGDTNVSAHGKPEPGCRSVLFCRDTDFSQLNGGVLCLYTEMYMLGSPLEHFQTICKNGIGDKHLSNILGKSLLRTEGKPEQKSYEWEDLMRDKG